MTRSRMLMIMLIAAVVCVVSAGVGAADDVHVTLEGHFGGGTYACAVSGNYACIGQGQDLVVLDVSSPASPVELGRVMTSGFVYGVAVSGDYVYVADAEYGIVIVDITDKSAPVLAGSYDTAVSAVGVAVAGDYAYVADKYDGLVIVDVSSKLAPTFAGSYDTAVSAEGVAVSGYYAYVADWSAGLVIVDITDKSAPVLAGSYDTAGFAWGVAVSGDYAYVADRHNGLVIVDITDKSAPVLAGSYDTAGLAQGVAVSGDYAYVADGANGLVIVDITDKSAPVLAGSYDTAEEEGAMGVAVSGDYAYVADWYVGLVIVDVSSKSAPTFAGSYDTVRCAMGVAVSDDYAYVGDADYGLVIVDITDKSAPVLAGSYDTAGSVWGVTVSGDYAYVADRYTGLVIVDITDKSAPVLAGSYDTAGDVWGVAVSGDYAYVAKYAGLVIVDITDKSAPVLAGSYDLAGSARGVAVSGDYAYVADWYAGLVIVDVSSKSAPVLAGSYDTAGFAWGVAVSGDYAYVADEYNGLVIVDITDKSAPVLAGSYDTAGFAWGVAVSGDYAYVADSFNCLAILRTDASGTDPQDKSLVQVEGQPEVYWFQNNRLYWVTDWNVINDMSGVPGWDRVNTLPASEFDPADYPHGPRFITAGAESDGLLIREQGRLEVYLISSGEKHHFTSPEALLWNGYSFDNVIDVSAVIIGLFPSGSDISITQAIIDKYNDLGGEATFGAPAGTGEQLGYPDSLGVVCSYVNFQNGAIECFTSGDYAGNAYAILNPFFDKWASMGYGKSVLGYPISDMSDIQTSSFGTPSRYQKFINGTEEGSLEYNLTSGDVFEIHGAIYAKWEEKEFSSGVLGLVTGDEKEAGISPYGTTGRYSEFENGHIHWISDIGDDNAGKIYRGKSFATYGDLDRLYTKEGGTNGKLGFPVMDKYETTTYGHGDCVFEGGKIVWDDRIGSHVVVYHGYLPDLVVTDISFSKDNSDEGEPITIYATIKNIGYADATGPFKVTFSQQSYYEGFEAVETGSKAYIGRVGGENLGAGKSGLVEMTWNTAPVFSINPDGFIHVEVDASNEIEETDENNNVKWGKVTIASRSNFKPEIDSYHFANFNPTKSEVAGMIFEAKPLIDVMAKPFLLSHSIDLQSLLGGAVCYGMSSTSILYYVELVSKPVDKDSFSMLKTDEGVRSNIISYQSMQGPYLISDILESINSKVDFQGDYSRNSKVDLQEEYNLIEKAIEDGEPVVSNIKWYEEIEGTNNFRFNSSHAILPFGTFSISDTIKNVLIYDSNYPGMARVITFDLENNRIKYMHYSGGENKFLYAVYFTTHRPLMTFVDGTKYLIEILKDFENTLITDLFEKKSSKLFFSCPITIMIVDQNGHTINDNGDNEIQGAEFDVIGDLKMFLLPADLDYTIHIDAYDSGNFSFTEIDPLTNESASIISFVDVPINENTKAIINIGSANPNYLMQIDYDGDGTTDETKEPDVIDTVIIDTASPASIANPHPTAGTTWINWTWTNPPDPDFNHTEIYLDGIHQTITSSEHYNATDLAPETSYTISTRTVDTAGNINQTWMNDTATTLTPSLSPPTAASSSATGAPKYGYRTNEDVYAAGSGFATGTDVDIHVVPDQDWNDGYPIPADVTGSVETVSVVNGDVGPVLVWHSPLVPGRYDIVIDADRNRVYDAATDGLDSGSPGFIVIADAPPSPPVSVPALAPHGIIALIGLLCVVGVSKIRRRFN